HGVRCFPINSAKRKRLVEPFYEKEVENPNGLVRKIYLDCEPVDGRQSAVTALRTCCFKAQNAALKRSTPLS
ncbi:hypothetical protein, partial [Sutterella wadsworthensis]|uniref:hypothetical protein n=1 Tax=Sutterella wadsworthensis TaxID=40545 RepID=UPI003080FE32